MGDCGTCTLVLMSQPLQFWFRTPWTLAQTLWHIRLRVGLEPWARVVLQDAHGAPTVCAARPRLGLGPCHSSVRLFVQPNVARAAVPAGARVLRAGGASDLCRCGRGDECFVPLHVTSDPMTVSIPECDPEKLDAQLRTWFGLTADAEVSWPAGCGSRGVPEQKRQTQVLFPVVHDEQMTLFEGHPKERVMVKGPLAHGGHYSVVVRT